MPRQVLRLTVGVAGLAARLEARFCLCTRQPLIASVASEDPEQQPKQKACQKTLDTEADDEDYIEERIRSRSESNPAVIEEQASHYLGKVSSPRVVVDQRIQQTTGTPVSPQEDQERFEN